MIKKMNNQDKKFYEYMGKVFGSRLIQRKINDRIFDDDNKEWYISLEEGKVVAFVSIRENVIKNIYTTNEEQLEQILKKIKNERDIAPSIVTNIYKEIYEKSGFSVDENQQYKNFVVIYAPKEGVAIA